ncbi:MFS transporter [uncultured Paracoccus sp.]|uniref:MFS transporter n=1 Tax=uncultured Paracoccus sp. TaxID=189685 RepID=UPI002620C093|nr:MFS transporter [uncultured Paracoccus sp.]
MGAFLSLGTIALTLAYTLSQFYRAFLAVLTSTLEAELGATPSDLALSSGMWFVTFALMQIPVGWALDRFGPRRTASWLLAAGAGGGAAVFALATEPWHLHVSMGLIGIGCAPALMASYYIFAHDHPRARFGALAAAVVGFGSAGNILGAAPLVSMIQAIGWRPTLWLVTALTLGVAVLIALSVRDPDHGGGGRPVGRVRDILRLRQLWFLLPLFFVSYAASAAIRGLWAAPYLQGVHDASDTLVGRATLVMGVAMVVGNFMAGPITKAMGSIRRTVVAGHAITIAALAWLWLAPAAPAGVVIALLGVIGLAGVNYALIMAHARSFLPPHLVGRGVTLMNMLSIGGVGIMQFASRPLYTWAAQAYPPAQAFGLLFAFFLVPLVIGFVLYLLTPEAADA